MRKLFVFVLLGTILWACNPERQKLKHELKAITYSIDSLEKVYDSLEWDGYKNIWHKMDTNITFLSENFDGALQKDSNLMSYFGPYTGAHKLLGRAFKKKSPVIYKELKFTQAQIENLAHDVKNKLISDTDSILLHLTVEKQAVIALEAEMDALQRMLTQQLQAFELTHHRVDSIISVTKQNRTALE